MKMNPDREKELKKRGYDFIFYEENLKNSTLHMASYDEAWNQTSVWKITHEGNTWDFEFDRQGKQIAASISPLNLIDQRYMFRKIFLIDLESGLCCEPGLRICHQPDTTRLQGTYLLGELEGQRSPALPCRRGSLPHIKCGSGVGRTKRGDPECRR